MSNQRLILTGGFTIFKSHLVRLPKRQSVSRTLDPAISQMQLWFGAAATPFSGGKNPPGPDGSAPDQASVPDREKTPWFLHFIPATGDYNPFVVFEVSFDT